MDQQAKQDIFLYFDSAPVAMLLINKKGKIIRTNQSCQINFDYFCSDTFIDELLVTPIWQQALRDLSQYSKDNTYQKNLQAKTAHSEQNIKLCIKRLPQKKTVIFLVSITQNHSLLSLDHQTFFASSLAIAITDTKGKFVRVNPAYCSLVQQKDQELLKKSESDITLPEDLPDTKKKQQRLLKQQKTYVHKKRYLVQGKSHWVKTFVSLAQNDSTPSSSYYLIFAVDLSCEMDKHNNLEVKEKKLQKLVNQDSLTKLKSRRAIKKTIQKACIQYQKEQQQSILIFLDVDNFKQINDAYGHRIGDAVLKAIAKHLTKNIRNTDEAARIGGDEFVVLLRHGKPTDIKRIIERLSEPIEVKHRSVRLEVQLSIGSYAINDGIQTADDWVDLADLAMYRNKKSKN